MRDRVHIKLKDKATGCISEEISLKELVYNQNEIEFEFKNAIDELGETSDITLPYSDFLFYRDDYEVMAIIDREDKQ